MNKIALFGKNLLNKACEQGINNRPAFLKNVSAVGWALSCLAQVGAIMINDKIPSKEKKFLIPQEIMDGIVNVSLFLVLTSKATDVGRWLVASKKIVSHSLSSVVKEFKPTTKIPFWKINEKNIAKLKQEFFNHIKTHAPDKYAEADNFIEGVGIITSIVGSILACNVATPYLRNWLASMYQKKKLKLQNKPNEQKLDINEKFGEIDFKKYEQQFVKRPIFRDTASILPPAGRLKI